MEARDQKCLDGGKRSKMPRWRHFFISIIRGMDIESSASHTALLLTGGGARAAYQVGVLKAISDWYPRLAASPFSIYCGTSAGAINATVLACDCNYFRLGVKRLEWFWNKLHTQDIFHSRFHTMFGYLAKQGFNRLQASYQPSLPFGLLDNRPLRLLLNRLLQYEKIDKQIERKILQGLSITASNYQTSYSVTFYQGQKNISPWRSGRSVGVVNNINTDHLVASSAIPFVFPATQIGQNYYGDGSVHQISPLKPALKMGANRILVIDLTPKQTSSKNNKIRVPGLAQLGGHLMDAIFADMLSADIEHLTHINKIVADIGEDQAKKIGINHVETLVLPPPITYEHFAKEHYCKMPLAARTLMRLLGINPSEDSAITSFLLFEPDYVKALVQCGYENAQEHELKIRYLLNLD